MNKIKLSCSFYQQELHDLAKALLGKVLVRRLKNGQCLSGKIVEVEAYAQESDPAAHSFRGETRRNQVMFGPPGHLYVYFSYGMHYCCNVVSGPEHQGDAILIRALEPIDGIDIMFQNRYGSHIWDKKCELNVSNGPAKLCQAMLIDLEYNGIELWSDEIYIENAEDPKNVSIGISTRIGIRHGRELPWRYFIKENPWVGRGNRAIEYFG